MNISLTDKKFVITLVVVISVILTGVLVMFFIQNNQMNQMEESFNIEKDSLLGDYRELAFQYDSLMPQTDSMILRLEIERQKVVQLMEELETVKATNAYKIREYKKELSTMRKVMKHYVFQIDSLSQVNQELREENKKVVQRYEEASQTVNKLQEEKETLVKKVEIASQLEATDFSIEMLNDRSRTTRRLSKAVKIEICFNLSKNITTPVGEKPVYLRITAPNNEVLIKDSNNTFKYQDKDILYSIMRVIEYEGEAMQVCGYWKIEEFLFEGEYRVDVFADGYLIGQAVFELS
ncbi:hypothetical protein ACE01N_07930 [Saccharicrinis sp. FJH2]|uniref:hypothetical protein n=1 Tax=unclassified Saccharicrinis TaxID=2646859 RepID=UPI0035D40014